MIVTECVPIDLLPEGAWARGVMLTTWMLDTGIPSDWAREAITGELRRPAGFVGGTELLKLMTSVTERRLV